MPLPTPESDPPFNAQAQRHGYVERLRRANRWAALANTPLHLWQAQARARPPLDPDALSVVEAHGHDAPPTAYPLHRAVATLQAAAVADLLDQGVEVDQRMFLSTEGTSLTGWNRFDPNRAIRDAVSPLDVALGLHVRWQPVENGGWPATEIDAHATIVGMLLAAGATVNDKTVKAALTHPNPAIIALVLSPWGTRCAPSPLELNRLGEQMASDTYGDVPCPREVWRHLLAAGWHLGPGPTGKTPLDGALHRGHASMVHTLLDLGAPLEHDSLFQALRRHGHDATVIRRLIAMGAPVNPTQDVKPGMSLLYVAAINGKALAVRALLDAGATVDIPDPQGRTPLYVAAERGYAAVVELLLAAGADPTVGAGRDVALVEVARALLARDDLHDDPPWSEEDEHPARPDPHRTVRILEDLELRNVLNMSGTKLHVPARASRARL